MENKNAVIHFHKKALFYLTIQEAHNNNDLLCTNILKDQAQWRDKTNYIVRNLLMSVLHICVPCT